MKKLFLFFVCTFMCIGANAQNKGFDSKSSFGIAANYSYNYASKVLRGYDVQLVVKRVILDLSYFDGKYTTPFRSQDDGLQYFRDHQSQTFHVLLGYSFNLSSILNVYPLIGIYNEHDYNLNRFCFEFSFGAGAQLHLFDGVYANARVTRNDVGGGLGYYF